MSRAIIVLIINISNFSCFSQVLDESIIREIDQEFNGTIGRLESLRMTTVKEDKSDTYQIVKYHQDTTLVLVTETEIRGTRRMKTEYFFRRGIISLINTHEFTNEVSLGQIKIYYNSGKVAHVLKVSAKGDFDMYQSYFDNKTRQILTKK